MGLQAVLSPLFEVAPLAWQAPGPSDFDALLLTSANAARHAGPQLQALINLRCYCVGEATEAEARRGGFTDLRVGPGDGGELLRVIASDGMKRVLHLCGQDHAGLEHSQIEIMRIPVYAAKSAERLPLYAEEALQAGAVALLHSPRAARVFGALVDENGLSRSSIRVAAISEAAGEAAGPGWASVDIAPAPRDQPLLEVAAKLCNYGVDSGTGRRE
jgi:uroporphyrinogen-III synthase